MHLMIGFSANIPDDVAHRLMNTAGVRIAPEDVPLAMAVVVLQKFPAQMRELLLTPDHEPVPFDTETLITEDGSPISVSLVLSSSDKDNPLWHTTPTPPTSSKPQPAPPQKVVSKPARSGASSKSPSRKKNGRPPMPRSRRRRGS